MGRKKIEIKRIECATKRHMTFNKRSHGIIKKAKELSVLCEADVALVIIAPAGKVQHFSNRPGIEHVIERFKANIQDRNEAGMCSGNKEQCKGGCCGTSPSLGMQTAHGHIPIQQPLVFEATLVREQVQIKDDPCLTQVSVPRQVTSSEVTWPYGASGVHQPPSLWRLPGGEAGQLGHFSTQPRIEPMLQRFDQNIRLYMPEENMKNMQVSDTNPSSGVQSTHLHVPMQLPQSLEAPQCIEQVHIQGVQGVQSVEMGDPSGIATFVPEPSEIRGPDGTSDLMQGEDDSSIYSNDNDDCMRGPLVREQVQMQGVPFVEMGDPSGPSSMQPPAMPGQGQCTPVEGRRPNEIADHMRGTLMGGYEMQLSRGVEVELSLSQWEKAARGEIGSNAGHVINALLQNNWSADELGEISQACCSFLD